MDVWHAQPEWPRRMACINECMQMRHMFQNEATTTARPRCNTAYSSSTRGLGLSCEYSRPRDLRVL